jgi:hypothetical protein
VRALTGARRSRPLGLAPRAPLRASSPPREISRFGVGATLARADFVNDWDPTDRMALADPADVDDSPTSPIVVADDHTTRQRCEFEEDTVEEYFV